MEKNTKAKKYTFDADGQSLGRLATQIAVILQGKNDPSYETHIDNNNKVIVVNVSKIKLTGKKMEQKTKKRHSLYPGGLKVTPIKKVMAEKPEQVLYDAVKNMLPNNRLRPARLSRISFK